MLTANELFTFIKLQLETSLTTDKYQIETVYVIRGNEEDSHKYFVGHITFDTNLNELRRVINYIAHKGRLDDAIVVEIGYTPYKRIKFEINMVKSMVRKYKIKALLNK